MQFVAWMKDRFFLRFHMTLILGLTFAAGLGVTKLFLETGNTNLALRYGMAVAASYAVFLLLLKTWLWYIDDREADGPDAGDVIDAVDAVFSGSGDASSAFEGGGGSFGGGGASSSFADVGGTGGGSDSSSGVGDAVSGLVPDDGEGCLLVVVLVLLLAAIGVAGLYLIYVAPTILAEAAFEALLASSLLPGARKAESPGWVGGVIKATILPFAAIFVLGVGFGWLANTRCPDARRVADVLVCAGVR